MPDSSLRILIVDQNVTRAATLDEGLREATTNGLQLHDDARSIMTAAQPFK